MARWAQIQDGKAHWIFDADEKPVFAPYITVVPCGQDVQEGWDYDVESGIFIQPPQTIKPPDPLAPLFNTKLADLKVIIDSYLADPLTDQKIKEVFAKWRATIL